MKITAQADFIGWRSGSGLISPSQQFPQMEYDGGKDDQEYRREDEDHKGKQELDRGLLRQGFRPMTLVLQHS
jgi:hypothetical protein